MLATFRNSKWLRFLLLITILTTFRNSIMIKVFVANQYVDYFFRNSIMIKVFVVNYYIDSLHCAFYLFSVAIRNYIPTI